MFILFDYELIRVARPSNNMDAACIRFDYIQISNGVLALCN